MEDREETKDISAEPAGTAQQEQTKPVQGTEKEAPGSAEGERLSSASWRMPSDARGRVITIVVLALVLMTVWFMLDIVIVTFVLTFVFYNLQKYAIRGLRRQPIQIFKKIPDSILLLLIYVGVLAILVALVVQNTPMITKQITDIASSISNFDFDKLTTSWDPSLRWLVTQINFDSILGSIGSAIMSFMTTSLGPAVLNFLIALLISFLLLSEKNRIRAIGTSMETSRIAFVYRYIKLFFVSFCDTFGKVMKVQVIVAAINCAVSMTYLSIAGFPYIIVLGIMIFILGLIPVLGVFISMVPLLIIAFNVGGFAKIIEVVIMVVIIHCIEAYFLNPRLMSRRTSLPVSIVFVVLIISEKYIGAWGMLIGVPIFIYLMNVLSVDYRKAMEAESIREAAKAAERAGEKAAARPKKEKKK
ncbi:AI-2E family transporter [Clostridia bacterium]|nr:AI-2E family transporter [Clostridia bacterium]